MILEHDPGDRGVGKEAWVHGRRITWAVMHHVGRQSTRGVDGQPTFMFAGHPHRGALDDDYPEVGVAMWHDGTLHAFHVMPLTSKWQHLRYQ